MSSLVHPITVLTPSLNWSILDCLMLREVPLQDTGHQLSAMSKEER